MQILDWERGSGKSTYLIALSHSTAIPVIVATNENAKIMRKEAKNRGFTNAEIYSVTEYIDMGLRGDPMHAPLKVYVDELDWVLRVILGAEVDTASLTNASVDRRRLEI